MSDATRNPRQRPEAMAGGTGQNAKTLVKLNDRRIIPTALKAGRRSAGHQTTGRVSIQTVTGHPRVHTGERTIDPPTGGLPPLDRSAPTIPRDSETAPSHRLSHDVPIRT